MKAAEVQEGLLKQILTQNRETEYLNKYMRGEGARSTWIGEWVWSIGEGEGEGDSLIGEEIG